MYLFFLCKPFLFSILSPYSQTHIKDLALGSKKTKNASSCASEIITLSKDRKKTPFWEHWTAMYLTLFA